jgi:sulfide:quinone oxidoreductase
MRNDVLVLGGGVGGTLAANLIAKEIGDEARITLVDSTGIHVYQPGFLYVAVGQEKPSALKRAEVRLLRNNIKLVVDCATVIDTSAQKVVLKSGGSLRYDELLIATGSRTMMAEVPGAMGAHDFYTMDGSAAARS